MTYQKIPHLTHPKYRPEIDGLRAIAILSVVVFHAFPDFLPGGFIGVDTFFVISGFLISSIIFSSLERDRFSLFEFYVRRVRRIFPALIFVLLASFVTGWFVLFTDEYKQLAKHTAAGVGFVQNFILWHESGYFDTSAEAKPLLHLWSLAIEEQFYIFWPLLMAFVWKRNWSFLKITAVIAAVSFSVNIYLLLRGRQIEAFFLPYSRFWELMVGGVLAYISLHRPQLIASHKNAQASLGLTLICTGLLLLNKGRDFPGWWALLPTLGSFFIISAGPCAWLNQKLLASKPMVWVGLVSYPLYLWHWPILSYLRITYVEISQATKLAALIASIILAWITYYFIERPIRLKADQRKSFIVLAILLAVIGISAEAIYKFDTLAKPRLESIGQEFLYDRTKLGYIDCGDKTLHDAGLGYCSRTSQKQIDAILIGDSHADDKYFGISKLDQDRNWMLIGNHSCPPVLGINVETTVKDCAQKFEDVFTWIGQHPEVKTVVLSYFGSYVLTTSYAADHKVISVGPDTMKISSPQNMSRYDTFNMGLRTSIERLLRLKKQVVLLVDIPELPYFPRDCVRADRPCLIPMDEVMERQSQNRKMIIELHRTYPSLLVFDPKYMLCNVESCSYKNGATIMYRDSHHLTLNGSEYYGRSFIEWLNNH